MTTSFKPVSVAISDLVAHPANVRSNSPETYNPENIAHLKASISVLGLLQPLLVQQVDGKYAVLAGGRRHAALKELVADKAAKGFTAKTKVDCRLVPDDCDVTTALSLAENITQSPMSPIDEFEAFARMMEVDGQTPETIAKTFGTTVAAVKGRLSYGLIHPDIRAAARVKTITLDTMKAFAEHPSQEMQREVFEARGGAVAADLLEEHSVLEDAALVETILLEKLGAAAEEARAKLGFAWADAMVRYDYATMAEYGRVYPGPVEPDEVAQKGIDEITAELEKLQLEMEDEGLDDVAYNALYDRVDALEEEARDLQEAYSPEDLARAGIVASWSGGKVTLHVGLVRPEDTVKEEGARGASGNTTGEEASDAGEITYPAPLAEDLKTERAMALGAAMALHPEATLDLTLFKLVSDVLGSGMSVTQAIKIDARKEYRSHAKMDEIDGTSLERVAATHDALDLSWLDDTRTPADQFAAFRALDAGEKAKLVAYATASTTQSCFARDPRRDSLMHEFEIEIEIMPDIRAHWTPNAALFNRFKKAWLLKILGEDLGLAQEAVTLASSSKKEIVAFCDKLFAEPFATLTDAQCAAVAAWCPPMMQTAGVACDETVPSEETPEPDSEVAQAA